MKPSLKLFFTLLFILVTLVFFPMRTTSADREFQTIPTMPPPTATGLAGDTATPTPNPEPTTTTAPGQPTSTRALTSPVVVTATAANPTSSTNPTQPGSTNPTQAGQATSTLVLTAVAPGSASATPPVGMVLPLTPTPTTRPANPVPQSASLDWLWLLLLAGLVLGLYWYFRSRKK